MQTLSAGGSGGKRAAPVPKQRPQEHTMSLGKHRGM